MCGSFVQSTEIFCLACSDKLLLFTAGVHTSIMVANSIPQGQVKAGDKIVNDVKLTNIPAGRFDGQLRPYSQADVEKLR